MCMTLNRKTKPSRPPARYSTWHSVETSSAKGYDYTGALRILRVMLSYDYLWINIRVKGGAYGCGGAFGRGGNACISSYRDPNVGRTLEVYRGIGDYVRNFEADERQMTKYIIGTISELDVPMNPSAKGQTSESAWFNGITEAASSRREIRSSMQPWMTFMHWQTL